jgi:signal transduction histidine kinase
MSQTRLPPKLETSLFRIVQEAVTNVVRHANAVHLWVALAESSGEITVEVRDDGVGFEKGPLQSSAGGWMSLGLRGMQERARIEGGILEVSSRPGIGTTVRALIPINPQLAEEA